MNLSRFDDRNGGGGFHHATLFACRAARNRPGFSLIELLVVIVIVSILMVFLVPSIQGITGGAGMTRSSEETASIFQLARQRASTFNRQVAIRFYEETFPAGEGFGSYQIWDKPESASDPDDPASWVAVGSEKEFVQGVMIKKDSTHSPLLEKFSGNAETKPRGAVTYSEVLFTPAGGLVARSSEAHLTFVPTKGAGTGGKVAGLPPNFATVVIEPFNARPTIYRP